MIPELLTPSLFFFNDTATTEIYTLSLHDALPISSMGTSLANSLGGFAMSRYALGFWEPAVLPASIKDRKSTRLNSSHGYISYAVFCLKKKKEATIAVSL